MDNFAKVVEALEENPYTNILKVKQSSHLLDCIVSRQNGREIAVGNRRLIDFASCNYLGFDLHPKVIQAIPKYLDEWGTHPSWARIIASPRLYEELETELANFVGYGHTLALPTLTITHFGLLRVLAGGNGIILIDRLAHKTIHDAALLATTGGARVYSFPHNDIDQVELLLKHNSTDANSKIICVDGVYSMSGEYAPLKELQELSYKYGAIIYVDDAHGIGVIGERNQKSRTPYGDKGNGIIKHLGLSYDNIVYVSGLSKAFSSLVAFVACPSLEVKESLKSHVTPYSHSGPVPVASLASALESLKVNYVEGDRLRDRLYGYCVQIRSEIARLGLETTNVNYFPIISILVGDTNNTKKVGEFLFEKGLLTTLGIYPYSPKNSGVIRISVTAAHTQEQILQLVDSLTEIRDLV